MVISLRLMHQSQIMIQFILLAAMSGFSITAISQNSETDVSDLNREVFELGLFAGILNIGDFSGEPVLGLSASFQASEDFFIQYNYLQADVAVSSVEQQNQILYFNGSDRKFVHYDLLVGYNLFQGEMFPREGAANLSSFYLVGGVGDTQFGDEETFTYTYGVGYKMLLLKHYVVHADYRNYLYQSSLVRDEEKTTSNTQFSIGLNYLF